MKKLLLCSILAFSIHQNANAQLTITDSLGTNDVANLLTGFGVNISNLVVNCDPAAIGEVNGVSMIPISQGLLLSTGNVNNFNYGTNANGMLNASFSDPDVSLLNGGNISIDLCVLEFDCVPQGDTLLFNFAFGSEEYPNYVGSAFNDAFGIFMSGPGINGLQNVAHLPNGDVVSINNVNAGVNSSSFIDNPTPNSSGLTYGGFTQNLQVFAETVPGLTYHFKTMITDIADGILDSGVLLEAFSFRSSVEVPTSLSNKNIAEVQLFPNPNNGIFTLKNTGFDGQTIKVSVIDITGCFVRDILITSAVQIVDLSDLNSGLYHLNMMSKNYVLNYPISIQK